MIEVVAQTLDEGMPARAAIGRRAAPDRGPSRNAGAGPATPRGPAANTVAGVAATRIGDAREQRAVVAVVGIETVEHVEVEATTELAEHPPDRLALGHRRDHRVGVLRPGRQRGPFDHREVGAFDLRGRRQHVRRELERARGRGCRRPRGRRACWNARAVRSGSGNAVSGLPPRISRRAQVAGLDLVDHRRARVLPCPPREIGTARRRARRTIPRAARRLNRRPSSGNEVARVHAHAARAVRGSGHHEQHPPQPRRPRGRCGASPHRCRRTTPADPRRGSRRAARRAASGTSATAATRGRRARLEQLAQHREVVGIGVRVELGRVGAVAQQLAHQPRQHEVVGAGPQRDVAVGERGGLGSHRDRAPTATPPARRNSRTRVIGSDKRGAVAVRHDGIGAEDHEQLRVVGIPHGRQLHVPGDELGRRAGSRRCRS